MGLHHSIFPEGTQNGGKIRRGNFAASKKVQIGSLNVGWDQF